MIEEELIMSDIKHQIMDEIEKNSDVFIKASSIQYRIRCPICGDSPKNPKDAHCYIKCSYDPNEPLLFNCFLCNAGGVVSETFLEKLGVSSDLRNQINNRRFNKIASLKNFHDAINIVSPNASDALASPQARYITSRLGEGFTIDDFENFKIVWDLNNIFPYITDRRIKNSMPSNMNSISFLSDDKSSLLTRYFSDEGSRWRKIKIFPSENRSFYTIKATLDLFTNDDIEVNMAEGVMDVLSIYKNFRSCDNSVFIATLGSDYISGIDYIILKGLIGYNVTLRIYIDSDVNERDLKYRLKKYKWLFNNIYIMKNIKSKDVGVTIDKIKLVESKI